RLRRDEGDARTRGDGGLPDHGRPRSADHEPHRGRAQVDARVHRPRAGPRRLNPHPWLDDERRLPHHAAAVFGRRRGEGACTAGGPSPKPIARQRKERHQGGAAMPDFIDVRDARFEKLIHGNARIDKLWSGGRWAEGPAYFPAGKYLIWSDIPNDRTVRWDEASGHLAGRAAPW